MQWLIWGVTPFILFDIVIWVLGFIFWGLDIQLERLDGEGTTINTDSFKFSFLLLIIRELILFVSLFWLLLSNRFSPEPSYGISWFYIGRLVSYKSIPLLNTIILLTRRVTLTLFHLENLKGNNKVGWLILTVGLGLYFITIQWVEYKTNKFTIRDATIASIFYTLTLLHAIHVVIAIISLIFVIWIRIRGQLTTSKNTFIDCTVVYWHFVDVVWLFLFMLLYYWPQPFSFESLLLYLKGKTTKWHFLFFIIFMRVLLLLFCCWYYFKP